MSVQHFDTGILNQTNVFWTGIHFYQNTNYKFVATIMKAWQIDNVIIKVDNSYCGGFWQLRKHICCNVQKFPCSNNRQKFNMLVWSKFGNDLVIKPRKKANKKSTFLVLSIHDLDHLPGDAKMTYKTFTHSEQQKYSQLSDAQRHRYDTCFVYDYKSHKLCTYRNRQQMKKIVGLSCTNSSCANVRNLRLVFYALYPSFGRNVYIYYWVFQQLVTRKSHCYDYKPRLQIDLTEHRIIKILNRWCETAELHF